MNKVKNPFEKKPYGWIQWKGTSVCVDIHCSCGCTSHFDGEFMYYIKCPSCKSIWYCNGHVLLEKPEDNDGEDTNNEGFI